MLRCRPKANNMESTNSKKPLQILLVEDSPSDAALLQENILSSGNRDIRVSVAQSLNEALVHLENNHTDAVLLDLTLPDSSGLDTVLRAKLACADLPIIVLTGVDDEETGIAAMRMGVQDYLVKGWADGRIITRAIHYSIERKKAEEALRQARDELEMRVQERTKELSKLNVELTAEIAERKRREERIRITNVLLELFAQKTTRKEYLDSVVKAIRDWSGCRCAGVRLVDSNGFIPYESCVGFSEQFLAIENMISLKSDACSCIRVVTQKPESQDKPVTTPRGSFRCDNAIDFINKLTRGKKSRYRGNCVRNGFASLAIVPVRYREEILGAIHLADEKEGKVPPETVEFLENMAMLIGEAVHRFNQEQELKLSQQQLRLLTSQSSQLSLVEEKERRRIASDLHDSVGQILAFASRELRTLKKTSSGGVEEALGEVCNQLDQAIKQTRTLSFDLSPSILYDLGLEVAIEDLAERFCNEKKIKFRFESVPGPKPLAEDVKILLYRAVRELLINIAKHADARTIRVSLAKSASHIHITVEDDGKGFDVAQLGTGLGKPKGFGIFSIRERLGHVGGRMEIDSVKDKGTKVTLVAPLGE